MPKVSIVIPTCNRPELLKRALKSVAEQTYTDYEIVVVDDGQKERADSAVAEFSHLPITYIQNEVSLGGGGARNRGITVAQGEFVAFLDDDDRWVPDKLKIQVALLEESSDKIGFVFSAVENCYPDKSVVTEVDESVRDYSVIALTRFKGFLTSSLLVRKKVLDEVEGFDETLPSHQDPDLIIRITRKYQGIGSHAPLVKMRMSDVDDHIGGNIHRKIDGRERILDKHKALLAHYPGILAKHYFWLGLLYRQTQNYKQASSNFRKSLSVKFSARAMSHALVVYIFFMITKIKHWIIRTFFKPAHVGTFMREMYAKKYLPKELLQKNDIAVLDAGCGKGQYAMFVADRALSAKILAVDIQRFSEWTTYTKYPNIDFQEMDLHNYDEVEKRDLTVSIDVLEHILDNRTVLDRLCRGVKKDGYLFFAIPCRETNWFILPESWFGTFMEWEKKEHIGKQLLLDEWALLIEKNNFSIEVKRYIFTFWGQLAWEIEVLNRDSKWGSRINVLLMPLYRLFAYLDVYFPVGKGANLILAKKL